MGVRSWIKGVDDGIWRDYSRITEKLLRFRGTRPGAAAALRKPERLQESATGQQNSNGSI